MGQVSDIDFHAINFVDDSTYPPINKYLTPFPFSNLKNSLKSNGSSMSIIDPSQDFHLF